MRLTFTQSQLALEAGTGDEAQADEVIEAGLLAAPLLLAGNSKENATCAIQRIAGTQAAGAVALQPAALAGTVTITPSNDSSGATDAGNINQALSTSLAVYLSPDAYYIDASLRPSSGTSLFGLGTSPPSAFDVLGFGPASGGDEVFEQLVLARIIANLRTGTDRRISAGRTA